MDSGWIDDGDSADGCRTDLYQHRIELPPTSTSTLSTLALDPTSPPEPQFTTIHLPLSSFVLTNHGYTAVTQSELPVDKIRTIGFALLGGGRGEENIIPVSGTPTQAQITELRRRAGAGFGKGGGQEAPDHFVEAMLAEDGITVKGVKADPVRAAGYHRAGQTSSEEVYEDEEEVEVSERDERSSGQGSVKVTPWSEGYYELCIKSVEAVNYDPMAEDEGSLNE